MDKYEDYKANLRTMDYKTLNIEYCLLQWRYNEPQISLEYRQEILERIELILKEANMRSAKLYL